MEKWSWYQARGNQYSQHRQNYQNKFFRARVDKELPKQFPKPFLVGKQNVGNFAVSHTYCKLSRSQELPKIISGRVKVGNLLPASLLKWKKQSPLGTLGDADCIFRIPGDCLTYMYLYWWGGGHTMPAGINAFRIPSKFWRICVVLNSNSSTIRLHQPIILFTCVYSYLLQGRLLQKKNARYVYLIQSQWCSEVFTYVYVYWSRNSGPETKECACISSYWGGNALLTVSLVTFVDGYKNTAIAEKREENPEFLANM